MGSASGVESKSGAATELRVGNQDTTVDNVGIRARASGGVIDVAG